MGLKLMAELGLDGTGFRSGFRDAERGAHEFAAGLKSVIIQAIGIATIEQALAKTVETARDLVEQSERLGIAPEKLQVLRQAAKDSSIEMDKLATSIEKTAIAREKALMGGEEGKKIANVFKAMGIDSKALQRLTGAQLLMGPIAGNVRTRDADSMAILFQELGIKGFGKIIPVLKTDFDALEKRLRGMNAIMDTLTAVKLKNLNDGFSSLAGIIYTSLGPALVGLAEFVMDFLTNSKLAEGIDFLIQKFTGEKKLPGYGDYSAVQRADAASSEFEQMRLAMRKGLSFEEYKRLRDAGTPLPSTNNGVEIFERLLGSGFADEMRTRRGQTRAKTFGDVVAKSWREELKYLNSITQPVADVANKAGKQSASDFEQMRKAVADWKAKMKHWADELANPEPPQPGAPFQPLKPGHKIPTDSLVGIGNFFGRSGLSVNNLAYRQVQLLEEMNRNLKVIAGGHRLPHPAFAHSLPFKHDSNFH